jgi:hypothetical protein
MAYMFFGGPRAVYASNACNGTLFEMVMDTNQRISSINKHITLVNTELKVSVDRLSQENTQLNRKIDELNLTLNETKEIISRHTSELHSIELKLTSILSKIENILLFIPSFVKNTSKWFVQLLIGIKIGNVNDISAPQIETSLLTEETDRNIVQDESR